MTDVAIIGAAGRMGRRLVALAAEQPDLRVVAAIESPGHEALGQDAGQLAGIAPLGVPVTDALTAQADVLIDFSAPAATRRWLAWAVEHKTPIVIGTTGLTDDDRRQVNQAAASIPLFCAPNMSVGVNLLFDLVGQVARRLGNDYDIEITETHHRYKKDAPSGTALHLAQRICDATGRDPQKDLVLDRHGHDAVRRTGTPDRPGDIGMHAVRAGDAPGEHTVVFAALGERVELRHVALSRDTFARGALRAAAWITSQPPGRVHDMLELLAHQST